MKYLSVLGSLAVTPTLLVFWLVRRKQSSGVSSGISNRNRSMSDSRTGSEVVEDDDDDDDDVVVDDVVVL